MIIALALLASCSDAPASRYHGFLYFGAGSYLGKFSLKDGSSEVVSSVGNANIRAVTELYDARLLLALDAFENDREVAKIIWLDVDTLQDTSLFGGVAAVWVPGVLSYVYDDASRLSAVSTDADHVTDAIIMEHRFNAVAEIIVVSGAEILFQTGSSERREVWHYDLERAALTSLEPLADVCGLRHSAWLSEQRLLVCRSLATGRYVRVTLEGEIRGELSLPAERPLELVEYVDDQRLLVFSEPWRTALGDDLRNAVWVHELETGHTQRIAEHQYLGRSTVYRRD